MACKGRMIVRKYLFKFILIHMTLVAVCGDVCSVRGFSHLPFLLNKSGSWGAITGSEVDQVNGIQRKDRSLGEEMGAFFVAVPIIMVRVRRERVGILNEVSILQDCNKKTKRR
jgi:hypothetical protein